MVQRLGNPSVAMVHAMVEKLRQRSLFTLKSTIPSHINPGSKRFRGCLLLSASHPGGKSVLHPTAFLGSASPLSLPLLDGWTAKPLTPKDVAGDYCVNWGKHRRVFIW